MKKTLTAIARALLLPVIVGALALGVHAEDASKAVTTKPAATTTKPADTAKSGTTAKTDATVKPADTGKKVKTTKKKKPKAQRAKSGKKKHKAPSVCSHLDAAACGANKACDWIVPKHHKKHKLAKPYCRLLSGVALKHAAKPANQSTAKTN